MAQLKDLIVTGNSSFSGVVQATTFTGALAGTASYALNAVTATRATTAGYATTAARATTAGYATTASAATTAGYATTANYANAAGSATTASNSTHAASADVLSSVLPISQGGTSATTAADAFTNIVAPGGTMSGALTFNKMIGSAENFGSTLPSSGVTNQIFFKTRDTYEDMSVDTVIPVANGGTGATDAATARTNLNLGSVATYNTLPVNKGGTGATNSTTALYNLGAAPAYSTTTTDPGVGSSLTTGKLLFVYTA